MQKLDGLRARLDTHRIAFFGVLCVLFAYPVIDADILYRDDLSRVFEGAFGWGSLGRPLASEFTRVATFAGGHIIDTGPLGQLVFTLSLLSAFSLATGFFNRIYANPMVLPLAVVLLNPFFLANMLYQYDSLGMGLAILLVVAGYIIGQPATPRRFVISVGLLFMTLALYQPVLNLFIGFCALQVAIHTALIGDLRGALRICGYRALQFLAAYLFYAIAIGVRLGDTNDRSGLLALNAEGLSAAAAHAGQFALVSWRFYGEAGLGVQIACGLFLLSGIIAAGIWLARGRDPLAAVLGGLLAGLLATLALFGPMVMLTDALAVLRTVPAHYVLPAILVVYLSLNRFLWPFAVLPLGISIVLSFQIMAAYKSQRSFDEFVAASVAYDISAAQRSDAEIYSFGALPAAPHTQVFRSYHRYFDDFVEPSHAWQFEGLLIQYGLTNTQALWTRFRPAVASRFAATPCSAFSVLSQTDLYTVLDTKAEVFVILPDAPPFPCLDSGVTR